MVLSSIDDDSSDDNIKPKALEIVSGSISICTFLEGLGPDLPINSELDA